MVAGKISKRVVADRLGWVDKMLSEIRKLPLDSKPKFMQDTRNIWTAESCLRRALEALFDLGRHILAKGFGEAVTEYKEIAIALNRRNIIANEDLLLMQKLAGYRNRLVHFYHDVSEDELFEICSSRLGDVEQLANSLRAWL
ncbi:MAG: type VII toxin-antitoxin system HepT family RNase toxin, partial [Anaerolineales bacterium]